MPEEINVLKLTDTILAAVLRTATDSLPHTEGTDLLYGDLPPAANDRVSGIVNSLPDLDSMSTGQEIYEFWKNLADVSVEKAKSCTELYNKSADQVIALEDEKNACYQQADRLKQQLQQEKAQQARLNSEIQSFQREIESTKGMVTELERKIEQLKKDKKAYDILRWFPIINLISEIVAALDGTREELSRKKDELDRRSNDLQHLYRQQEDCAARLKKLENEMDTAQLAGKQLEVEIKRCQTQRDTASKEMIAWKDREQYYLNIAGEMEHLIAMEAGVDEFKKLIADHPPAFQLAA